MLSWKKGAMHRRYRIDGASIRWKSNEWIIDVWNENCGHPQCISPASLHTAYIICRCMCGDAIIDPPLHHLSNTHSLFSCVSIKHFSFICTGLHWPVKGFSTLTASECLSDAVRRGIMHCLLIKEIFLEGSPVASSLLYFRRQDKKQRLNWNNIYK